MYRWKRVRGFDSLASTNQLYFYKQIGDGLPLKIIMNKIDSKAFIEGRKAYFDGVSTTNNPYGDVGEDSQQWLNGYFSSQFY